MLLNCKDVSRLSTEYLEKQLDKSLTLKIRFHLLLCGFCRKFIKHMEITHEYVCEQQKLKYIGGHELDHKVDSIMKHIAENGVKGDDKDASSTKNN